MRKCLLGNLYLGTTDDSLLVGRSVVLFFGSEKVNWEISQTWETWNSGPCFWRVSLLRETWNSGPCVCRVSLLRNPDYFIWYKDQKKWTGKYLKGEKLETVVHVLVGLVYCEIIYISCVLTKENKRIALRNSNTKTVFQRFMENTWTTTWSLHSVFKRSGVDLVTTMTSLMKKTVSKSQYVYNKFRSFAFPLLTRSLHGKLVVHSKRTLNSWNFSPWTTFSTRVFSWCSLSSSMLKVPSLDPVSLHVSRLQPLR